MGRSISKIAKEQTNKIFDKLISDQPLLSRPFSDPFFFAFGFVSLNSTFERAVNPASFFQSAKLFFKLFSADFLNLSELFIDPTGFTYQRTSQTGG